MEKIPRFNKRRDFKKAVGPGKNPKLITVGPTFIPDYRVKVHHNLLFFFASKSIIKFEVFHLTSEVAKVKGGHKQYKCPNFEIGYHLYKK